MNRMELQSCFRFDSQEFEDTAPPLPKVQVLRRSHGLPRVEFDYNSKEKTPLELVENELELVENELRVLRD